MRRERREEIDNLLGRLVSAANRGGADELGNLSNERPSRREIGIEFGTHFDGTDFHTSSVIVGRRVLFKGGMGISEERRKINVETWLVGFDGQHHFPFPKVNQGHEVDVRMQGISRVDAPGNRQAGE